MLSQQKGGVGRQKELDAVANTLDTMAEPTLRRHAGSARKDNWGDGRHAAMVVVTASEDDAQDSEIDFGEDDSPYPPSNNNGAAPSRLSSRALQKYFIRGAKKKSAGERRSRILYVALCTVVLTAVVVVRNRRASKIEDGIRRMNVRFLSNHNCPRDDRLQRTAASSVRQGPTKRRLAQGGEAGGGPDVDPKAEVACVVAEALSRVAGGQTGQSGSHAMSRRLGREENGSRHCRLLSIQRRQVTGFSTLRPGLQWH